MTCTAYTPILDKKRDPKFGVSKTFYKVLIRVTQVNSSYYQEHQIPTQPSHTRQPYAADVELGPGIAEVLHALAL
jgi:hypothetical protein